MKCRSEIQSNIADDKNGRVALAVHKTHSVIFLQVRHTVSLCFSLLLFLLFLHTSTHCNMSSNIIASKYVAVFAAGHVTYPKQNI